MPLLVQGLSLAPEAIRSPQGHSEELFRLTIEERQFQEPVNTAFGLQFPAVSPSQDSEVPSCLLAPAATMEVVVPSQQFRVDVSLVNPTSLPIQTERISPRSTEDWEIEADSQSGNALSSGEGLLRSFTVTTANDATISRPYFQRERPWHESRVRAILRMQST